MEHNHVLVLIGYPGYWGIGATEREAIANAVKAGATRQAARQHHVGFELDGAIDSTSIWVDDFGGIRWERGPRSEDCKGGRAIQSGWVIENGKRRELEPSEW